MPTETMKPTLKELRAHAQSLGITPDSAGGPIEDLLRTARDHEDPLGFLAIHAPPGGPAADRLPAADELPAPPDDDEEIPAEAPDLAPTPPTEPRAISEITIAVPLVDRCSSGNLKRSIHIADLSMRQRTTLKRLTEALMDKHSVLERGRIVANANDAVRWLLENIAANP